MANLIRIIASFVLCLGSVSGAWAATAVRDAAHPSVLVVNLGGLGIAKDTVAMDALVDSLQGRNLAKVSSSAPLLRSRTDDKAAFSASTTMDRTEEANVVDLRMLIAGLMLVGVIALRRMS